MHGKILKYAFKEATIKKLLSEKIANDLIVNTNNFMFSLLLRSLTSKIYKYMLNKNLL